MPTKPCKRKGKSGLKFGDSGKCYTGKDKKSKVARQRRAIKSSESRRNKNK